MTVGCQAGARGEFLRGEPGGGKADEFWARGTERRDKAGRWLGGGQESLGVGGSSSKETRLECRRGKREGARREAVLSR